MTGGTTNVAAGTAALKDHKDISAAAGNHFGNIVKIKSGQCHHDFVTTDGNARLTSDGGYPLHRTIIREKDSQTVLSDVHAYHM